jgi:hypothetical protein
MRTNKNLPTQYYYESVISIILLWILSILIQHKAITLILIAGITLTNLSILILKNVLY